eukprot:scaffold1650_cov351-Prasinococcus_capsulatus_cf.AAC.18
MRGQACGVREGAVRLGYKAVRSPQWGRDRVRCWKRVRRLRKRQRELRWMLWVGWASRRARGAVLT